MAQFKYIGAPHDVEVANIPKGDPECFRDGREWDSGYGGYGDHPNRVTCRYRLVFSTAEAPDYAGYAVCLGEVRDTENIPDEPEPDKPVYREVFTVYLASGQTCKWPQNKPEDLLVFVNDDGVLDVRGPRNIPSSIFAAGSWTHCGVRLVEQAS